MQIAVTFRHLEANEGLKDYVREKVGKLEKYIENPMEIHVVLSTEKFRQMSEITIVADGMTLNSQAEGSDLYTAIDQMVEKMERQIRERRDKSRRKRGNASIAKSSLPETEVAAEDREAFGEVPRILRRQVFAKPMSLDEAVAELNLSQEDILFFINSTSGQMNALYRGKEGLYEWVEPQPA
jgi:putative sigma-54 modulation protein